MKQIAVRGFMCFVCYFDRAINVACQGDTKVCGMDLDKDWY
jgi:hypothetical protein